ncbi:MAG TPA: MCP four helix bundle domain-containing protein, partial [Candidatus Angelobacter sp.]|nr:MCP four helix bundle domain-containing protein [Candidatus Angelobacter sp.]
MKWFSDLKIARKLAVSFGLIMVIMTGMGVFAIVQFAKLYEPTKIITSDSLPSIQSLGKAAELASSIRRS